MLLSQSFLVFFFLAFAEYPYLFLALCQHLQTIILGDPGADKGGKGKPKTCVFLAPIRSQNGGDRLELVW